MSTNLEYRARERQRKRESGRRPAKLKEKKGDRDLEREIKKTEGDISIITPFYILFQQTINIIENFAFTPG